MLARKSWHNVKQKMSLQFISSRFQTITGVGKYIGKKNPNKPMRRVL
uniref:Uncharacterized protein n=1 Tax=Zonotrichia albicollis TaxID=44394 RepID=A0A8D2MPW0_ZONAL